MKTNKLLSSLLTIVVGILFIMLKSGVISIAMTVMGVSLIFAAIIDFSKKHTNKAIFELIIGLVIIIFGWTLLNAAIIVLAVLLLINGIMLFYQTSKIKRCPAWRYIEPVMSIIVALCLLFNQGGTISFVFIIAGICLIIEGLIGLATYFQKKF